MVDKVNGKAAAGEALGRDLQYFSLALTGNFKIDNADANDNKAGAAMREKLIEVISLRGQPVILGNFVVASITSASLKFAIEHNGAWTATSLQDAIAAHCKVVHLDDGVVGATAVATLTDVL